MIRKISSVVIQLTIWSTITYMLNQACRVELRTFHVIAGQRTEHLEVHIFLILILVVLFFKAILFYANGLSFLAGRFNAGKRGSYLLRICLSIAILSTAEWSMVTLAGIEQPPFHSFVWLDLLLYLLTAGISLFYFLTMEWEKAKTLSRLAAEEQLKTELSFLKAQINPHLFLNTLNNLYSMAQANETGELEDGILKLSEMMRYILYECQADTVSLEKEIDYIRGYIGLTLLRHRQDGQIQVDFETAEANPSFLVAPVILIPFVENAFKHGISLDMPSVINIRISVKGGQLFFMVKNTDHAAEPTKFNTKGIGITNVRRRLEMLYPNSHRLEITNINGWYSINLQL